MKYKDKAALGVRPFQYDTESKAFHQGAWRNHPPEFRKKLERALYGGGDD